MDELGHKSNFVPSNPFQGIFVKGQADIRWDSLRKVIIFKVDLEKVYNQWNANSSFI